MKKANAFATLKLMHGAMLMGQLIFIAVLVYMVYGNQIIPFLSSASSEKILQAIAIVVTAAAMFAGISLFKKKLALIKEGTLLDAKEKFSKYRQACLLQWALTELPVLVCCICFFITANYAFLALAAVPLAYFVTLSPVKDKTAMQLDLSSGDLDEL